MSLNLQNALAYNQSHHSRFVSLLGELVKIPSISTDPEHCSEMLQAANWLSAYLQDIGLESVSLYPPDSHPLVYAECLSAGPGAPTVLIYGHYDVQPADPLDQWESEPFTPTIRGENFYGRGASDMKGNVFGTIFAVESCLKNGGLPVNVKFLIEGQEEIGSQALTSFLHENTDLLSADFCLNTDTGMLAPDLPTITYALRGMVYFELQVAGPARDLHSGLFGGAVHNPAQALSELIAGMHDQEGRITLPGFYDDVQPLTPDERQKIAALPAREQDYLERTGISKLWGEPDYTFYERITARPTLEVNGMISGFTGKGVKTIIPSTAMAKISCRLVSKQDPMKIQDCLIAYLESRAPETIRWKLITLDKGHPSISDIESPWIRAMVEAQTRVFGVPPLFRREGGSVPVVADLQQILGIESINVGIGLPDDNVHAPNEKLHLPSFYRQIDCLVLFFSLLGELDAQATRV